MSSCLKVNCWTTKAVCLVFVQHTVHVLEIFFTVQYLGMFSSYNSNLFEQEQECPLFDTIFPVLHIFNVHIQK